MQRSKHFGPGLIILSSLFYASYGIWIVLLGNSFSGYTASAVRSMITLIIVLVIMFFTKAREPLQLHINGRYIFGMFVSSFFIWGPRLLAIQLGTALIYIFIQLGTRVIFLRHTLRTIKKSSWKHSDTALYASAVCAILLSLILVQRGQWWNVVQFQYVGLFLLSIPAGLALADILTRKTSWSRIVAFVLVLTSLAYSGVVVHAFSEPRTAKIIPRTELEALAFLKEQPYGMVYAQTLHHAHPQHIGKDVDVPYVSYFSNKPSYNQSPSILSLFGIEAHARQEQLNATGAFNPQAPITYIYSFKDISATCSLLHHLQKQGKLIYNKNDITIHAIYAL